MDKTKRKTFMFIPSELTELSLLRNQKSKFSNTTDFYSLGYKIPEIYGNQSNDSEVVLILGFYDSFSEKNEVCPYCGVKIQSNDNLHICAQSLKKYKFDRSCIKTYYPLLTNESYIWISLDMNKLPSLLKHGILMKYSKLFYSQNNNWLYSIMNYEIGQSLCTLILWSNQFTLDYNTPCCDQLNYERKYSRQYSRFIEIIVQIFTKLFNKTIQMSYTFLLIKYQYDTSKKSSKFCTNCLNKLSNTTTNTTDNSSNISTTNHSSMSYVHYSKVLSLLTFVPDPSLVIFCAIQLLILILCLITVPHNHHHHHHSDNNHDFEYCTPHVNKSSSQLSSCNTIQSNDHTITTNTAISSSWLPNDLNCKIIPTLGLFYLDKNEENYTLTLSSTNLSSSSFILYNSTKELMTYLSPSTDYCQMNILYRYIEYFTCELTRLLLWLEQDTIELITLHLTSFYIYATHLLRLQLKTIAASWRLCRNSSKWNPLRNRVDKIPDMYLDSNEFFLSVSSLQKKISSSSSSSSPSSPTILSTATTTPGFVNDKNHYRKQQSERSNVRQENVLYEFVSHKKDSDIILCDQLTKQTCGVYLDRLLVSTLLGLAIGLCLFTTTIAFYITFASVQLVLLLIKNSLKSLIWFIMDFPLESSICWLLNSSNYQTKLIVEAPRTDSKYFPFLQLKVTRIDFNEMYHQNHLLHKPLFPSNSLSFMEIFYRLLSAQDIR
ncbi:unnamed protein product [Schistosoma margrebowiei]|uniref:Uncharacterized protein n=1 Tax=Schistosoma margrebowiei TaxID=48269 RepID=A0AA85AFX7_9TREM|nr:unnamed protein product [Schistosoma margrebowiei]